MTDAVLHLVRRATWGPTPGLLEEVTRKGTNRWLEEQLNPSGVPDAECEAFVRRFTKITRTIPQVWAQERYGSWGTMQQLGYATIGRYCWSRRQLFEVVCDFWSNHLNVVCPSTPLWADRHDYDANVVRRNALGSFAEMLLASSRHPSMLRYLNGASSRGSATNQNYGRELLELHTVGVDGGYTEADVQAAAQVMTGWYFLGDGTAAFSAKRHDGSAARVMGWSTPAHDAARGPEVQASLLAHLARHPATARRLAAKLCQRFVSDTPPASLVTALAKVYLDSDTRVVPVLRALFTSPEFAASAGAKTRRPLEGLVAVVRALGIQPGSAGAGGADGLFVMARDLGHAPLSWAPPNGYPDVATAWVSAGATMRRWNCTWEIASRRKPADLSWPQQDALLTSLPRTWGEFVPQLVQRLLFRRASAAETTALLRFCDRQPSTPLTPADPWVNARLADLVAMVLDAPGHMER
ncbi:DUF1800 domain-containing protein [Kineococcus sp. SYSU DK006]|uniref:DUF1800 domain-containing protein n=1 Tax=Kineococcus sp. SYSU DK006 TaxID=3383127 RepID=UPI003D7E44D3